MSRPKRARSQWAWARNLSRERAELIKSVALPMIAEGEGAWGITSELNSRQGSQWGYADQTWTAERLAGFLRSEGVKLEIYADLTPEDVDEAGVTDPATRELLLEGLKNTRRRQTRERRRRRSRG
jgi:hypothetical protein